MSRTLSRPWGQSVVQSVGERPEHCPCPEKQGSHSPFISPLILVLYFISFHLLRSPSYFQWSTWGQRDVSFVDTHTHPYTCTHTQGHTWAWERQLKEDKFIQRAWLTVTQEGPSPFVPLVRSEASYPSFFLKTGSQGAIRQDGFCTIIICDPFLSCIFLFHCFVCLFLSCYGRVALGLLTTAVLPIAA